MALWGLLGLAGLAGLAGLKKKPEQHTTVRPAHVDTRHEPVRTTNVRANDTVRDADRQGDKLRDPKLDRDLDNDGRRDI
ncbi:WGxxGxxG-CTERM domain-containing protein [Luteococcus sp. OSA5]|uniref:WGxxGxxG-CTERM domain-containing protein n=1 Tax=Luteococcus sp. OSA5 TaxID=3401630 RepID=UPI003B436127